MKKNFDYIIINNNHEKKLWSGICASKKCHADATCVAFGKDAKCICNAGFKGI